MPQSPPAAGKVPGGAPKKASRPAPAETLSMNFAEPQAEGGETHQVAGGDDVADVRDRRACRRTDDHREQRRARATRRAADHRPRAAGRAQPAPPLRRDHLRQLENPNVLRLAQS